MLGMPTGTSGVGTLGHATGDTCESHKLGLLVNKYGKLGQRREKGEAMLDSEDLKTSGTRCCKILDRFV